MSNAVWRNGQVVLDVPAAWPEGHRLAVHADPWHGLDFMTEDQQSDDPAEIERWIAELAALPALTETAEEAAARRDWAETMRQHNLDAVRRQFETAGP